MKTIFAVTFLILVGCAGTHAQESADIKRLEAAADFGDSDAACQLGTAYETGVGVHQDYLQADFWYAQASSHGNKKATERRVVIKDAVERIRSLNAQTYAAALTFDPSRKSGRSGAMNSTGLFRRPDYGTAFDAKPADQLPSSETSAWKKTVDVVTEAPAKVKQFMSDHTDEITDLAEFVIERYVTGTDSSEGTTSKSGSGKSPNSSK